LILSEWRSELAWLPVETLIHNQQHEYYHVLGQCDNDSDCTLFIVFMLEQIIEVLSEGIASQNTDVATMPVQMPVQMSVENRAMLAPTAQRVVAAIEAHPAITITQLADQLAVNPRTIERHLKILREKGRLLRVGATKNGYWQVIH